MVAICTDCGVSHGELHELFCTKERCPFCGGQLVTCSCISNVLKLSSEEQEAVDEYIDDSIPPLSQIMQRWQDALNRQGRVPFEAFPDDPLRAAYRGDLEAVQRFIDGGFSLNTGNEVGYTALMAAARGEKPAMIQFILAKGGSAALADRRGYTALHWAVAQSPGSAERQIACIRALLDAGADANARNEQGITPLMNAAWFGCFNGAVELLQRGADPTTRDNKNRTAQDMASERGHQEIEELLK